MAAIPEIHTTSSTFSWEREVTCHINSGETVKFITTDSSYHRLSQGEDIPLEEINLVTGPLYVNGAEPGDALRIEVLDIEITRAWSVWISSEKACGCLAAKRAAIDSRPSIRTVTISGEKVMISDRLSVPLQPMIGCIATAPTSHDQHAFGCGCSTFEPTYPHGGNMDLRDLSPRSTIWLPVQNQGGLLWVGDLHACMGEGEPTWVGFEASGIVTLRVHLEQQKAPPFPKLRVDNSIIFTAVDKDSHENALQSVLSQAYEYLILSEDQGGCGLTPEEAFGYACAQLNARLGGPASKQVIISVPRPSLFPK